MTNDITFLNLNEELELFVNQEVPSAIINNSAKEELLLDINEIVREDYTYDNIGITVDINNKVITEILLVDDAGSFDLLSNEDKEYIEEVLKDNGIFEYTLN